MIVIKAIFLSFFLFINKTYSNTISLGANVTCYSNTTDVACVGRNFEKQGGYHKGFKNIQKLASGLKHNCLVDEEKIHCWRNNDSNQLAQPELKDVSALASGTNHTSLTPYIVWTDSRRGFKFKRRS